MSAAHSTPIIARPCGAVRVLAIQLLLLTAASTALHGQGPPSPIVRGRVTDNVGQPLEGARVYLEKHPQEAVLTGETGSFVLRSPGPGGMLLFVQRIGYNAQVLRINVGTSGWSGTIALAPGAFVLPEIRVAARYAKPERYAGTTRYDDIFHRMRLGGGTLIRREDIERWNPGRTVELLRTVPGAKVSIQPPGHPQGTAVAFVRCNEFPPRINVFVDGIRQMPSMMDLSSVPSGIVEVSQLKATDPNWYYRVMSIIGEILERISPNEIEMIEVYRGIGSLPPEFAGDACAAIAIWTRHGGVAPDTAR